MSSQGDEKQVPASTRTYVIERDAHVCRLCGVYAEVVHVHHLIYRSQGGLHLPTNLISLDWKCHEVVHANKPLWLPIMTQVAVTNGVNGRQLRRWYESRRRS